MKCALILLALTYALAAPVEDDALEEFVNGNHVFTAAIYKELVKNNPGNVIVSPFSVESVLALTYEGTAGATAAELISGLSLPSTKEKIERAYKSILPKLEDASDDSLKVAVANKIYVEHGVQLRDTFKSVAEDVYGSGVEIVSFEDNRNTAAEINSWVEEHTNHKIQNLISPAALSSLTQMILVNALYLYGEWTNEFYIDYTQKHNFFSTKGESVAIDMMNNIDLYSFYENSELDAKFLELPLKGGDVSVVFVLPNNVYGIADLEKNIEKVLAPQPFTKEAVIVRLPRFTVESQIEFVPILETLGVQTLFTPFADLSGLFVDAAGISVTDVVQKAFVNITEKGIEAAAATDVVIATGGELETSITFDADHPFLYYIKDNDVILFAGRYVDPAVTPDTSN